MSKIKQHFKKHKTIYIAGGSSIFFAGITYLIMRDQLKLSIKGESIVLAKDESIVLGENSTLNNVSYFSSHRQGPPSWVVRCLETNEVYSSQKSAAKEMLISPSLLSEHLNGTRDHVDGYHFERICMAA